MSASTYGDLTASTAGSSAGSPTDVDLRSDTVTRPCAAMRAAMADAVVGDDVYGEDPTVSALEAAVAERLGKEAALLFPTGTQSNLAGILAHCGRGDEALIGERYHTLCDEAGGVAVFGGVMPGVLRCRGDGSVAAEDVAAAVKPDDPHCPRTRLLCLENTVWGRAIPLDEIDRPSRAARAAGLRVHLDGARFFNAVTALGISPQALAETADTVSICLSKGLGAPVGSVLAGDAQTIRKAHRLRKALGGGMRQAGVFAAAGLVAVERNIERLTEDHARAATLRTALRAMGGYRAPEPEQDGGGIATNMAFVTPEDGDPDRLRAHMAEHGVRIGGQSPTIRLVLHRDVDDAGLERVIDAFRAYPGR